MTIDSAEFTDIDTGEEEAAKAKGEKAPSSDEPGLNEETCALAADFEEADAESESAPAAAQPIVEEHGAFTVTVEPEDEPCPASPPKPPRKARGRVLKSNAAPRADRRRGEIPAKKSGNGIFAFAGLLLMGIVFVVVIFAFDNGEIGVKPPPIHGQTSSGPRPHHPHKAKSPRRRPALPTGAQNAEALDELDGMTMAEYMRKHNLDQNQYLLQRQAAIEAYREMRRREARERRDAEAEDAPRPSERNAEGNVPTTNP